jgi:transcriptional regulator with XRE-family HTH domain
VSDGLDDPGMDDMRLGTRVRAVRLRLGWRQVDVAARAGVSQSTVCRVEHGRLETVRIGVVRAVLQALEIDLALDARWRGGELDRLADEDHAALVGRIAQVLEAAGWLVRAEVSYSIYGERGSIDLLAWHPGSRILLVVEVKATLNSIEETLRRHDVKARLAGTVAKERFGWEPVGVARMLALPDETTARRRVARHEAVLRRTYGLRAREVRQWLRDPRGSPGMLTLLSPIPGETGRRRRGSRRRVRRPAGTGIGAMHAAGASVVPDRAVAAPTSPGEHG